MKITITKDDLDNTVEKGIISDQQAIDLWTHFTQKYKYIMAIFIFLVLVVPHNAQNNEDKLRFMIMGGYLFHQAPPSQNYQKVENRGIVEAQMRNTIVLGLGLDVDRQLAHFSFRADIILSLFIIYDFLNWDGEVGNTGFDNSQVGGNIFTFMGNVLYKPWVAKKLYIIGGVGVKYYSTGSMAATIGNALFGENNPLLALRLGAGIELGAHFLIELNDNISYGSFLFDFPSMQEIENPKYLIHDIFLLLSYRF